MHKLLKVPLLKGPQLLLVLDSLVVVSIDHLLERRLEGLLYKLSIPLLHFHLLVSFINGLHQCNFVLKLLPFLLERINTNLFLSRQQHLNRVLTEVLSPADERNEGGVGLKIFVARFHERFDVSRERLSVLLHHIDVKRGRVNPLQL